jgi:hypothetical protein
MIRRAHPLGGFCGSVNGPNINYENQYNQPRRHASYPLHR